MSAAAVLSVEAAVLAVVGAGVALSASVANRRRDASWAALLPWGPRFWRWVRSGIPWRRGRDVERSGSAAGRVVWRGTTSGHASASAEPEALLRAVERLEVELSEVRQQVQREVAELREEIARVQQGTASVAESFREARQADATAGFVWELVGFAMVVGSAVLSIAAALVER